MSGPSADRVDSLSADELATLWLLARRLLGCESPAAIEALASAAAEAGGGSPALMAAIADTVRPALKASGERRRIIELSLRDPLTRLYNRRFMEEELVRQIDRSGSLGRPLAVVMIDLDHFRAFNERHGHRVGDLVLQSLADLLTSFCRDGEVACRYGGDEFLLMLPATAAAPARQRLEPLRHRLAEQGILAGDRRFGPVSASLGVAEWPADGTDPAAVLEAADAALYRAKRSGRNRIRLAGEAAGDFRRSVPCPSSAPQGLQGRW